MRGRTFKKCSVHGVVFESSSESRFQSDSVRQYLADEMDGRLQDFFLLLAVCHTLIIATPTDQNEGENEGESASAGGEEGRDDGREGLHSLYQGESPDELALCMGASDVGYTFSKRGRKTVEVTVAGESTPRVYEVLAVNAFSSKRKRMSVVVRTPSGSIEVLCKGADNVMADRAATAPPSLEEHLHAFACEGLRTLVMGKREVSASEWSQWSAEHAQASIALNGRAERLSALAEAIERDLDIIGASAIEDKLQENVPGTIADLHQAGIKLWVLTGDKVETAINIGFSANVLTGAMTLHRLELSDNQDFSASQRTEDIANKLQHLHDTLHRTSRESKRPGSPSPQLQGAGNALVLTGPALALILSDEGTRQRLLEVGVQCAVVVACRVSPAQKAELVKLVQRGVKPRPVTLAIGDGANDVPMLQQAQVRRWEGCSVRLCRGMVGVHMRMPVQRNKCE